MEKLEDFQKKKKTKKKQRKFFKKGKILKSLTKLSERLKLYANFEGTKILKKIPGKSGNIFVKLSNVVGYIRENFKKTTSAHE